MYITQKACRPRSKMVAIVRQFPVPVESLSTLRCVPSVAELRPCCCPLCEEPARTEEGLQIVGHGTYRRQVLGLIGGCREALIWIRRFLCRRCRRTISVLPDGLYPGRWYAGGAILLSLVLSLLQGQSDAEIRERFSGSGESSGWKTLERWRRQLLSPLWSWLGRQLGVRARPSDREQIRSRLLRLVSLHGADGSCTTQEFAQIAAQLVGGTAHIGSLGWEVRRGPPEDHPPSRPGGAQR